MIPSDYPVRYDSILGSYDSIGGMRMYEAVRDLYLPQFVTTEFNASLWEIDLSIVFTKSNSDTRRSPTDIPIKVVVQQLLYYVNVRQERLRSIACS